MPILPHDGLLDERIAGRVVAADPGFFSAANEAHAEEVGVRRVSIPSYATKSPAASNGKSSASAGIDAISIGYCAAIVPTRRSWHTCWANAGPS